MGQTEAESEQVVRKLSHKLKGGFVKGPKLEPSCTGLVGGSCKVVDGPKKGVTEVQKDSHTGRIVGVFG